MFLYGLLGTTYIFFYYLCVVYNNFIVKYQFCLNKLFSVSVSVSIFPASCTCVLLCILIVICTYIHCLPGDYKSISCLYWVIITFALKSVLSFIKFNKIHKLLQHHINQRNVTDDRRVSRGGGPTP